MSDIALNPTSVRHIVVTTEAAERRLDNFLGSMLGNVPRSLIYRIIRTGEVRVNGGRCKPAQKLVLGDSVRVPPIRAATETPNEIPARYLSEFEASVLFENAAVIVLNKSAGLAVHAGSGVRFGLIDIARAARPQAARLDLVHRLDRQTSGCLLLAKDVPTLRQLNAQLAAREFCKTYLALVHGRLARGRLTVNAPLDVENRQGAERHTIASDLGQPATTRFLLVRQFAGAALVEAEPETGRTHQIRAHALHIGHPLGGDLKYGRQDFNDELKALGLRRLFLHAASLEFLLAHRVKVEAPLPADLQAILTQLPSFDPELDLEQQQYE
jgi:23S rRNA pseudouridine955/2504/2580 synthase